MRHNVALLFLIIIFSGCMDRVICPAFQSTYILDDSVRVTYYSYLWKLDKAERTRYLAAHRSTSMDSVAVTASTGNGTDYFAYVEEFIVPPNEVNKSRFGIVKYEPYWLKNYKLKSAPMENVLAPPAEEEAVETPVDVGEFVASDFADTINVAGDSTSVALEADNDTTEFELPVLGQVKKPEKKKETVYLYRYDPKDEMLNVEQQYYNKHFGHQLYKKVDATPPASKDEPDSVSSAKSFSLQNLFGFGKRKKDPQESPDVTEPNTPPVEETPAEETDVEEKPGED